MAWTTLFSLIDCLEHLGVFYDKHSLPQNPQISNNIRKHGFQLKNFPPPHYIKNLHFLDTNFIFNANFSH